MDNVSLLGEDHTGETHAGAPEVIHSSALPKPEKAKNEEHRKHEQPDFVDRVAAVEDESRRDRHGERGPAADIAADERLEFHREMDRENAGEHYRQTERPDVSAEERLADKEN